MANILTAVEAANVLRCETTDAEMLALLPLVDSYVKNATGRDWTIDPAVRPEAKSAARMLLVRGHEDPGALSSGASALGYGLSSVMVQLKMLAIELANAGAPDDGLEIERCIPVDGTDFVAVGTTLILIFNHVMASGSTGAVSLEKADGTSVATTNSLDATGKILRVKPESSLEAGTNYVLCLTAMADVYGMTISETIAFRTA